MQGSTFGFVHASAAASGQLGAFAESVPGYGLSEVQNNAAEEAVGYRRFGLLVRVERLEAGPDALFRTGLGLRAVSTCFFRRKNPF